MASRSMVAVAQHLQDLLDSNIELNLEAVYYGDQEHMPKSPTAVVEPVTLTRDYEGAPFQTNNDFLIVVTIYMAGLDGTQEVQLKCDLLTEKTCDIINTDARDTKFGGLVVSGMTGLTEFGYIIKDNKLLRANRIHVMSYSKTHVVDPA